MPVEPPPGAGDSYAEPVALRLLDVGNVAYVKGVWEGYRDALAWAQKDATAAIPTSTQWQGDRADRFHSWWRGANADLDSLATGISSVVLALEEFILSASWVNAPLAQVEDLVRTNTQQYWASPDDNEVSGQFVPPGGTQADAGVWITGMTMKVLGVGVEWPAWLREVQSLLQSAAQNFVLASDNANDYLQGAMAAFTSMHQFKHLGRSDTSGDGPFASDPTWQELTGGDVFRMPLSGFTTDPFGTKLMPDWYDPTTAQRISTWIGDNSAYFDVGAFLLTLAGQPEFAAGLLVLVHGTKLVLDATDGDTGEIPWDAADVVLDAGAGYLDFDDISDALADDVEAATYAPRHAAGGSLPGGLKGALGAAGYAPTHAAEADPAITSALRNWIAAQLKEDTEEVVGADGQTYTVLPASAISQVEAEAQGEYATLLAAHAPASAYPTAPSG